MEPNQSLQRYRQLQQHVRWSCADAQRVVEMGPTLAPHFPALIVDFVAALRDQEVARRVITGGEAQWSRLQQSLTAWLRELFAGVYDADYVDCRARIGRHHVSVGLNQASLCAALSRLRRDLLGVLRQRWSGTSAALLDAIDSLTKLMDLDLAIMQDAYESEQTHHWKLAERTRIRNVRHQEITELNEAQQRALQSERLAGIGQMITGLAHESRNALQRIQACAEMLELEVEGNADALDLVHRIKLAQDHLHRLFDEVRGYAAPVNLDRSACQLGSVWREAWELLLPQWEGRIAEMIARTGGVELGCFADHFRLVQLFRILFENSLAACADPVRIEITCSPTSLGAASGIRVSVRDNGPGLNREQREHMFEPFYTTKTKGTGLGLAIAQRIVEAHGGQISVGDGAGPGAEIVVLIPFAAPE